MTKAQVFHIMNSDGSNQANITKNALADDTHPSWK